MVAAVRSAFLLVAIPLLAASPLQAAAAPARAPEAGEWAAGGDLGFANPVGADEFNGDLMVQGYAEYFQTPRVSWRGTLSLLTFDGPRRFRRADDVDLFALAGAFVYNWDAGTTRPYLSAGVGLYQYDSDLRGDDLERGVNFGGGVHFLLRGGLSLRLDGEFHGTSGREPDSFFVGGVGLRYGW